MQVQREVLGTIDICKNELRGVRPISPLLLLPTKIITPATAGQALAAAAPQRTAARRRGPEPHTCRTWQRHFARHHRSA